MKQSKSLKSLIFLISPTTPHSAFEIGRKYSDPTVMFLEDIFTVHANLSGNPAISLPIFIKQSGMPVGFQVMADKFNEKQLFYFQEHYKMKKQVRILLLIVVPKLLFTQIDIPYQNGERLEYAISFGGILNVGYGDLEIKQQNKLEPEKLYIIGKGKTALFLICFLKLEMFT